MNQIEKVSHEFTNVLRSWLSAEEWQEMMKRNRTREYKNCCASHDFCDANEAMIAAFEKFGIALPNDDTAPESFKIWNEAWELARGQWAGVKP